MESIEKILEEIEEKVKKSTPEQREILRREYAEVLDMALDCLEDIVESIEMDAQRYHALVMSKMQKVKVLAKATKRFTGVTLEELIK